MNKCSTLPKRKFGSEERVVRGTAKSTTSRLSGCCRAAKFCDKKNLADNILEGRQKRHADSAAAPPLTFATREYKYIFNHKIICSKNQDFRLDFHLQVDGGTRSWRRQWWRTQYIRQRRAVHEPAGNDVFIWNATEQSSMRCRYSGWRWNVLSGTPRHFVCLLQLFSVFAAISFRKFIEIVNLQVLHIQI